MIGLYLGIESDFLDVIRINNNGDINHCFVKLLTLWLKRADPPATWLALIEALEGIDNDMVAERIRSTYILSGWYACFGQMRLLSFLPFLATCY